jgi:hypothetical protein
MQQFDYECALSGLTQEGLEEINGIAEDDDLGDLPVGWSRVVIQRRVHNPKWLMIQQVKEVAIRGLLAQMPPEAQQQQGWMISLQVEAQFHELEKDTPQFITIEDVAFLSNNEEVLEPYNEIREMFGLQTIDAGDEGDEGHLPHDGEVGDDDDEDDDE